MTFSGYREDRRGDWFGGGTNMIYINKSTNSQKGKVEFYIVNEQEGHLIRVRDEKQIELLSHCMYGPQVTSDTIDWLIKDGFKYYDSVEEYICSEY